MKILTLTSKILLFLLVFSSFPIQIPKVHAAAKLQKVAVNNLGLVGRWSFDGSDTTWTSATSGSTSDTSGQGSTGTLTNMNRTTSSVAGKIGQGFYFTGSADGVDFGSPSALDNIDTQGGGGMTLSFWIKPNYTAIGSGIIQKDGINSGGWSLQIVDGNGTLNFKKDYVTTDLDVTSGSLTLQVGQSNNPWQHVVMTWDGTNSATSVTFYINGVSQTSTGTAGSGAKNSDAALNLNIGASSDWTDFPGILDEVRIYNRLLPSSEISQMYNSGRVTAAASYRNVLTNGLVGLWTLDGADTSWSSASSGTVYDRSRLGNNGTINNSSRSSSVKSGAIGQAINFDQANDNINMGNITALNGQGAATWSFWLYQTSYQSGGYYLSKDNPNGGTQESWAIYNENTSWAGSQDDIGVSITSSLTSNIDLCIAQDADITLGQWMLVTVVFDGSQTGNTNRVKIYTNGVRRTLTGGDCNGTIPSSITNSSSAVVVGDSADATRGIDGGVTMDDIRIYNRALSDSEIKQLYNMGGSKVNSTQNNSLTSSLVGLWSFNGADVYWASSTSATAYDRSGQGKNGTVTNMSQKTSIVKGKVGQALNFDGVDDSIQITGDVAGTGALSVAGWIYPRTVGEGGYGTVLFVNNTQILQLANTNGLLFSCDAFGNTANSGTDLTFNAWNYIVVTRTSAGAANFYVNGSLSGTANQSCGTPAAGFADSYIGSTNNNYHFDGLIDEIRLYNKVLSPTEIKQLYNMGR